MVELIFSIYIFFRYSLEVILRCFMKNKSNYHLISHLLYSNFDWIAFLRYYLFFYWIIFSLKFISLVDRAPDILHLSLESPRFYIDFLSVLSVTLSLTMILSVWFVEIFYFRIYLSSFLFILPTLWTQSILFYFSWTLFYFYLDSYPLIRFELYKGVGFKFLIYALSFSF